MCYDLAKCYSEGVMNCPFSLKGKNIYRDPFGLRFG